MSQWLQLFLTRWNARCLAEICKNHWGEIIYYSELIHTAKQSVSYVSSRTLKDRRLTRLSDNCGFISLSSSLAGLRVWKPPPLNKVYVEKNLMRRAVPFTLSLTRVINLKFPLYTHHTVWCTWRFIAYSDERWIYYQFLLHNLHILNLHGSERVNSTRSQW